MEGLTHTKQLLIFFVHSIVNKSEYEQGMQDMYYPMSQPALVHFGPLSVRSYLLTGVFELADQEFPCSYKLSQT